METNPAYTKVQKARNLKRPTSCDYINAIFDDFFELHGDRRFADDAAIVGGIANFNGAPVTVIGIEKGHTTRERMTRSFGAPSPEGYRKALRLMQQAEKFGRPIICFVDTSGANCDIGAEERGQGQAIAENLTTMSALRVPIISILIGEGGSGGALALAVANKVWMLENAIYSVISPEGCASILWKDSSKAALAAEQLKLTAADAYKAGIIERIVSEKGLGSKSYFTGLKKDIAKELKALQAFNEDELVQQRYERFRAIGSPESLAAQGLGDSKPVYKERDTAGTDNSARFISSAHSSGSTQSGDTAQQSTHASSSAPTSSNSPTSSLSSK